VPERWRAAVAELRASWSLWERELPVVVLESSARPSWEGTLFAQGSDEPISLRYESRLGITISAR
jgi:hypothetical protein